MYQYYGNQQLTKNKFKSLYGNLKLQHLSKKIIVMKKLLCGLFALGLVIISNAQTTGKKSEAKFTPPILKKNEAATKSAGSAKTTPPAVKAEEKVKFTPPVLTKNKPSKKKEKVKFTPPVFAKDKSTK